LGKAVKTVNLSTFALLPCGEQMTDEIEQDPPVDETGPDLTPVEARVLGCLMEKQRTTPDTYPLTLNALVQACNQKTSRNPLMQLQVGEVGHTVNELRDRGLIHASFAGRAERYDHKMASNYHLSRQEQALMCALMLRGPQTAGELRTNAGRMAEFADLQTVEQTLTGLTARKPPLVTRLPRLPGKREERFGQLLCGEVEQQAPAAAPLAADQGARDERIDALEAQVKGMREELDALWKLTGLADQRPGKG
jgi:uncharacterized protein YceH (UPF0502 family)